MSTRAALQIADSVLYEGYVLYPYRASALKNQLRWQIGIVVPRAHAEGGGSDPWFVQTECLVESLGSLRLTLTARGLHVQDRGIEQAVDGGAGWRDVGMLQVDDRQLVRWEEGVVCQITREALPLDAAPCQWSVPWDLAGHRIVEAVRDRSGRLAGRIVRRRSPINAVLRIAAEPCEGYVKVRVRVENQSACAAGTVADRIAAIRSSLAGVHAVLQIQGGAFVSLLDPPAAAARAVASCSNLHTFPVLVGDPASRSVMLSSPVILYDYPAVAPESPGDWCDSTEIDELLMLRVKTLTDDEKREARATDERARDIIDRGDAASADVMGRLHGAIRHVGTAGLTDSLDSWEQFLNPAEAPAELAVLDLGGVRITSGSRVRLEPWRSADSMDLYLKGRAATVTAVYRTLEDQVYVAVRVDGDPYGDLDAVSRRALFFRPDEIFPLDCDGGGVA